VTVVTGEAARGMVAAEVARQEGAFLGWQRYRLERARDTLVRELANGRSHEGQRSVGMRAPAIPSVNPHLGLLAEELEAMLERKLKLRLMRVVRALEKIEERVYGLCDVTEKPIARVRREQRPEELEVTEVRRRLRMTGGKIRGLP
jgi:RNA polymerase-binding transcription factor DksA